jgi:hypothetical protein
LRRIADKLVSRASPPSAPRVAPQEPLTMIYEHRTYQIQAGKAGEFLKIYEAEGLGIITRYAKLIGCWTKETGVLNSVVFIWTYDDFAHRSAQRQKLAQDPEWAAFTPKILPFLVHQESIFLTPVAFSPLK